MGRTAIFSVVASGTSIHYQWTKNGVNISGANGASYTTPLTTFSDSGSNFAVSINSTDGAVVSDSASLTVTARAPSEGDLRFQQVDADTTVNGWGNAGAGLSAELSPRAAAFFSTSLGTMLYVGAGGDCAAATSTPESGCDWFYSQFELVPSATTVGIITGYASDSYNNLVTDLQTPTWPGFQNGATPSTTGSVITSLDIEFSHSLFAVSWIQSEQAVGYKAYMNTVSMNEVDAAAAVEGSNGRVITAISNNNGSLTYVAYSWSTDASTAYEYRILVAPPETATASAASLADSGYIISATGLADESGSVILVGIRVEGDTASRPFIAALGSQAISSMLAGYANVGVIVNLSQADPYTFLYER